MFGYKSEEIFFALMIGLFILFTTAVALGIFTGYFKESQEQRRSHELMLACVENGIPVSECIHGEDE